MLEAKLVTKSHPEHQTIVQLSETVSIGGTELLIIGGPCTVENSEQMGTVASKLSAASVQALRGGVYKPRTSPYAFQGMGIEGLEILADVSRRYGLPVDRGNVDRPNRASYYLC